MINPDHIINYTKATPEEKQKIKAILLSNYAILVNEFIKEADYSNVSGYKE
jgi:hypothetical protein